MSLLSPISNHSVHRTTSEPELNGELGKRTMSSVSTCSRSRTRTSHMHFTPEELSTSRARAVSVLRRTSSATGSAATSPESLSNCSFMEGELSLQAFQKLKRDLERAQQDLRSRDDQCQVLSRVRDEVDLEIEELTASLFEEAHKMVYEANVGRANAEKKLYETQLKLDGLQAEVSALKLLVLTSTPSNPGKKDKKKKKGHQRTPSAGQICLECETYHCMNDEHNGSDDVSEVDGLEKREVDRVVYQHFLSWVESHCPLKDHSFLSLIHKDDIVPCLRFPNEDLAKAIYSAIQNNWLSIEAAPPKLRRCALTNTNIQCPFRVNANEMNTEWHYISSMCRSRVVAVVDFLVFLRYIRQGIIKKDVDILYWEMVKKRADMSLARLNLHNMRKN